MPAASSREIACSSLPTRIVSGPPNGATARSLTLRPGHEREARRGSGGAPRRRSGTRRMVASSPGSRFGQRTQPRAAPAAACDPGSDRRAGRASGSRASASMRASSSSDSTCSSRSASAWTCVERQPERLREVLLEQPVMPDDLERDALARRRSVPRRGTARARRDRDAASFLIIAVADGGGRPFARRSPTSCARRPSAGACGSP